MAVRAAGQERVGPVWCNRKEQAVLALAALGLIATLAATRWTGWDRRHTVGLVGSGLLLGGALVAGELRRRAWGPTWEFVQQALENPQNRLATSRETWGISFHRLCEPWDVASIAMTPVGEELAIPTELRKEVHRLLGRVQLGWTTVTCGRGAQADAAQLPAARRLHRAVAHWLATDPAWVVPTELGLSQLTFGAHGLFAGALLFAQPPEVEESPLFEVQSVDYKKSVLKQQRSADGLTGVEISISQRWRFTQIRWVTQPPELAARSPNMSGSLFLSSILHFTIRRDGQNFRPTEPRMDVRDDDQGLIWSYTPPIYNESPT